MPTAERSIPCPNPNPENLGPCEFITLAEQSWPIPKLAIRQLRVILPSAIKLFQELGPIAAALKAATASGDASLSQARFSEEQIDLMTDIVYQALTRAHKNMSRDDVIDLPISISELSSAMPLIMKQAGMVNAIGAQNTGEVKAGS